ncbi:MAG: transcription antitermination factor NusB [Acidimicrobiales bacterium]
MALRVIRRIEGEGAYANLALGPELERSNLDSRDRAFATELVYGTTRMRRACDFLVERFVTRAVDDEVRSILRLGAYQLAFADVAAHAAVGETVELAPKRARGFVNAILRRVATAEVRWPDDATRLSYPDWLVELLIADIGEADALEALTAMNESAGSTERDDGYTQDEASQWVAALVEAEAGMAVADLCAAPGGKATAIAASGAYVVAIDVRPARAGLVLGNARRVGVDSRVGVLTADGLAPPLRPESFDRVLLDAPCSGLGSLRRRADARWRIQAAAVNRLADLQMRLVDAAVSLLAPGGVLIYSVCTLTARETLGIDEHLARAHPELETMALPPDLWREWGRGALLLPQFAGTDGMAILRLRRPRRH